VESPDAGKSLANMNPNGLPQSPLSRISWWAYSLPGIFAGLLLTIAGLWRHSPLYLARKERAFWRSLLTPLAATGGRAALEEGRARFHQLLAAGPHWRQRLAADGRWAKLEAQTVRWDEAFFAESRDGEPWVSRWNEARSEMEDWK
jgi:hypothetical protein